MGPSGAGRARAAHPGMHDSAWTGGTALRIDHQLSGRPQGPAEAHVASFPELSNARNLRCTRTRSAAVVSRVRIRRQGMAGHLDASTSAQKTVSESAVGDEQLVASRGQGWRRRRIPRKKRRHCTRQAGDHGAISSAKQAEHHRPGHAQRSTPRTEGRIINSRTLDCDDDFKYDWRSLRSSAGIRVLSHLTLALGIGATSVIFTPF